MLSSCSGSIFASDYDQTCETDEDCVIVNQGEKCAIERCSCGNAAINNSEFERYQAELESLVCVAPPPVSSAICVCGPSQEPVCSEAVCSFP